jgi:agarase
MTQSNFNRRDFIKTMGVGAAAVVVPTFTSCGRQKLDKYGGLESIRFDATGFFRVEKGNRWWLVTPDGGAFLSFGLNHTDVVYLLQDYNINFWKEKFGFEDRSDPAFREGFINKVMEDIELFGMNTLGCHARKEIFGTLTIPYVQGLFFARTAYWLVRSPEFYPDVFSAAFKKQCERVAKRICLPKKDDPFLIGYTFTNVPILTDLDAEAHGMVPWGRPQHVMPTWPRALRNKGPKAPCKKVFVDLMLERYPSIRAFNSVYKTRFSSFNALSNSENWSPFVKTEGIEDAEDNRAFLMIIYDQYYTVTCGAVRQFDPNHLILGDPINANTPPPDEIISLVAKHTDIISYQYYGAYDEYSYLLDRWSELTGMPIFNTDSNFAVPYEEMPNPVGPHCPDQETRARLFMDFATRAFSRPDFIGWHWCGWMDSWPPWRKVQQHCGLQDPFGRYQHPMPKVMSRFGSQIYDYGLGKRAPKKYSSI